MAHNLLLQGDITKEQYNEMVAKNSQISRAERLDTVVMKWELINVQFVEKKAQKTLLVGVTVLSLFVENVYQNGKKIIG
jgi:hypothetical protein